MPRQAGGVSLLSLQPVGAGSAGGGPAWRLLQALGRLLHRQAGPLVHTRRRRSGVGVAACRTEALTLADALSDAVPAVPEKALLPGAVLHLLLLRQADQAVA